LPSEPDLLVSPVTAPSDAGAPRHRGWLRLGLAGAALALAYLVTVALTLGTQPGRVRPLYEGFAPPSNYHWVRPPRIYAASNQRPTVTHASVRIGPRGSLATGIATDDAQLSLGMAIGAVARHGSGTSVAVTITPLDAAALAPLPLPYRANGNAYDIAMVYQPSGTPVTRLAGAGASMVLITPLVGDRMYTTASTEGPWAVVPSKQIPPTDLTLGASIRTTGYYLGGTTLPALHYAEGSSSSTIITTSVVVGLLAALVLGGGLLVSRRRRRRPS
jgi:MYXO-CTERM domain-containing protein